MQEVAFVMSAPDFATNQTIQKPWGSYTDFIRESGIVLKEIVVSSGKRLSLQSHNKRKEYWIVFEGTGKAIVGEKEVILSKETIVQVADKSKMPELLEADFCVLSNDEFHKIIDRVKEEVGSMDSKKIFFYWNEWLKKTVKKM